MRTPIETCIILLEQTLAFFSQNQQKLPKDMYERAEHSMSMCIRKLTFVSTFVEDMLGVNMANAGVLTLAK